MIQIENAKLNYNYYQQKALDEAIDPAQKETGKRLLDKFTLDNIDNLAFHEDVVEEDSKMEVD